MQKWKLWSISFMVVSGHLCATNAEMRIDSTAREYDSPAVRVVHIDQLSASAWQAIKQGDCPETAVEFAASTQIPIHFFLTGSLFKLIDETVKPITLEVQQTFYVRAIGSELLFSLNLIDWQPLPEFVTGTLSVMIDLPEAKPCMVMGAELYPRSPSGL